MNIVTKKPQFKAAHAVEALAGSYDLYRATLDTTGPIGDGLAYRLNVALEDKDSFRDYVDSKRQLVAPALTWILSDRSALSYDGEYLRRKASFDHGDKGSDVSCGDSGARKAQAPTGFSAGRGDSQKAYRARRPTAVMCFASRSAAARRTYCRSGVSASCSFTRQR